MLEVKGRRQSIFELFSGIRPLSSLLPPPSLLAASNIFRFFHYNNVNVSIKVLKTSLT